MPAASSDRQLSLCKRLPNVCPNQPQRQGNFDPNVATFADESTVSRPLERVKVANWRIQGLILTPHSWLPVCIHSIRLSHWKGTRQVESTRFDAVIRGLASAPSRRAVVRGVLAVAVAVAVGGAAGSARMTDSEAKEKCGPCKKKKKGKCKKNKPNNTPCNGEGTCLNGVCNQPPVCSPAFTFGCVNNPTCCSGACSANFCAVGAAGTPCLSNPDCFSNACIGFRCQ
jgi:hypothetical protein